MSAPLMASSSSQFLKRLMWLRVHLDALIFAPGRYLAATWWRLTGKRLRSRARFAFLMGRSAHAYPLWIAQWESADAIDDGPPDAHVRILAVIEDAASDPQVLDATLADLTRESIAVRVVQAESSALVDWTSLVEDADWLLPMRAGDRLAPGAGSAYRAIAAATPAHVIYADDDVLDARSRRTQPHFKPDWNAVLFQSHDYLTGSAIIRAAHTDLSGLAPGEWVRTLIGRIGKEEQGSPSLATQPPVHLRRVLHHRVSRPAPVEPQTTSGASAGVSLPSVSVIVPTRNRVDLLRTCLEGVAGTAFPDVEILVVDNGSDDPETLDYLAAFESASIDNHVLRVPGPFNYSRLNNLAASKARGELLCLLNNDIEVRSGDWLAIMALQALRPDVGAVGAQLLYPDGRIQHAGVVLGISGAAAHAHRFLRPEDQGYHRRHALPQFVSAVTAACLVVRADRFAEVGGLDEHNFAVAFNDVDLCLRLNARGWQSFYEPRAVLVHHESVSRGQDRDPVGRERFAGELAALRRIWGTDSRVDPFHHPQLSSESEQFVVGLTRFAKATPSRGPHDLTI